MFQNKSMEEQIVRLQEDLNAKMDLVEHQERRLVAMREELGLIDLERFDKPKQSRKRTLVGKEGKEKTDVTTEKDTKDMVRDCNFTSPVLKRVMLVVKFCLT